MVVKAPNTFVEERRYALEVMLGEFLGLDFEVEFTSEVRHYEIAFEGGSVTVQSAFWDEEHYLSEEFIPGKVHWMISPYDEDEKIPVIYGDPKVDKNLCYVDVFASAFFMLTRWEETVVKDRDQHDRFPVEASLAYQQGFLHIPVVNRYVELLWGMLQQAGFQGQRKHRAFDLVNTCDVDTPFVWQKPRNVLGRLKYHLTISKKPWLWLTKELPSLVSTLFGGKDPADTYDYLMDWSEKAGTKSHFFFMDYGFTEYDQYYRLSQPRMKRVLERIKTREHKIGFHPSYNLYDDPKKFNEIKASMEKEIGTSFQPIGRHHYLRFQVPTTWQIWEDAGMQWDSTLSYASVPGFRCGVCYPFPVFNVQTKKQLKLVERPLILMEQSCIHYLKQSPEEMKKTAQQLIHQVARYQGEFVLLWHNATLNTTEFKQYKPVFESIMEQVIALKKQYGN